MCAERAVHTCHISNGHPLGENDRQQDIRQGSDYRHGARIGKENRWLILQALPGLPFPVSFFFFVLPVLVNTNELNYIGSS
jgi:hypothetical protein